MADGAHPGKTDYLARLSLPFTAEGIATIDRTSYPITLSFTPECQTVTTHTDAALPLSLIRTSEETVLRVDGQDAPIPKNAVGLPLLFAIFSLSRADLVSVSRDRAGETPLTVTEYENARGKLTVILAGAERIPAKIEGTIDGCALTLIFESFTQTE